MLLRRSMITLSALAVIASTSAAAAGAADASGPGRLRPFGGHVSYGPTATAAARKLPSTSSTSTLTTTWVDGATHDGWHADFTGYGTIARGADGTFTLAPKSATSPGETHAALLTSVADYADLDLTSTVTTTAQLRQGSTPNPWEVAWLLWHHSDNTHFYYVALKPNGFELGKEDPAYPGAQRFLVTDTFGFPIGSSHVVRVHQAGPRLTVWVDGVVRADFVDDERPYLSGHVGLYDEDSATTFSAPSTVVG